ncbi:MAG TPA: hypothetical protein VJZ76_17235 [Thermoanaerobaculia bacterium]|nr:hypothetical protein [Thermoanaerobaculia bacterium]
MNKRLAGAAVVVIVAAVALLQSWQRWLDPIIDTGRDLYIPEQLARGAKLYRDLRYEYPPLAPYLLALMPSRSLAAYTVLGIFQSAVVAVCLWLSLRRNAIAATAAALFFVALSMCGASTWGANFIFPYSYAATLGMMLIVVALAAVLNGRVPIALVALFLATWCKVEYAAGVALIVVVLTITRRLSLRQIAVFAGAWLASFAFVIWMFPEMNLFGLTNASAKHFFAVVAGSPTWEHLLLLLGIVAVAALLRTRIWWAGMLLMVPLAYHGFFRAWFFLQLALLAYALVKERDSPLAVFAVFAVATTLRVPFHISPAWYGFVLIVPVYALIAYVLFERWPSPAWLALVAMLCARDLWDQHERWGAKVYPIDSARGTFYDHNAERAQAISALKLNGTLVVLPEGITINYLTRTTTPLSFHTFTPPETADLPIEDEILREINARPPQHIALVNRNVAEYGSRGFGVDYDRRLMAWIAANYETESATTQTRILRPRCPSVPCRAPTAK